MEQEEEEGEQPSISYVIHPPTKLVGARKCLMCVYIETDCSTSRCWWLLSAPSWSPPPPSCLTTLGQSCLPCCFAPLLCGGGGVLCEIVAVCNLQQMTLVVSTARDGVRAEAPAGGSGAGAAVAVKEAAMLAASCVRACEGDASTATATATAMRSNHRANKCGVRGRGGLATAERTRAHAPQQLPMLPAPSPFSSTCPSPCSFFCLCFCLCSWSVPPHQNAARHFGANTIYTLGLASFRFGSVPRLANALWPCTCVCV